MLDDVGVIFDCPKQSLYRWVKKYTSNNKTNNKYL